MFLNSDSSSSGLIVTQDQLALCGRYLLYLPRHVELVGRRRFDRLWGQDFETEDSSLIRIKCGSGRYVCAFDRRVLCSTGQVASPPGDKLNGRF